MLVKTLWSLIPVRSYSLGSQLNFFLTLVKGFTETEVSYFYFSIVKDNVLRLEIIVNDSLLLIVKVFHTR